MITPPHLTQTPRLTPHGHLLLVAEPGDSPLPPDMGPRVADAFTVGSGNGLLDLGSTGIGRALPLVWSWWRDFAARYVTSVCAIPEGGKIAVAPPAAEELERMIADAPPMIGAEYLSATVLATLWAEIEIALLEILVRENISLPAFLKSRNPAWNQVGRVHFNLAENRKDVEAPFAFLATWTARLSAHGKAQHQPLSQALAEFSSVSNRGQLLSLLVPVQRASEQCEWLREMVDCGDIYHPLRWTPQDACRFLGDLAKLESAGIIVRTPATWQFGRPARPQVKASVGSQTPSLLGTNAMLDFNMALSLDGEDLSAAEIKTLLKGSDGFQLFRGQWIEVDKRTLSRLLERFKVIKEGAKDGLSYVEAMRLLAGTSLSAADDVPNAEWSQVVAGPWLAQTLAAMREPEGLAQIEIGAELKANLRPYQQVGVRWLYLLTRLGLGACLADDMGLGKTIQVLALLLVLKRENVESQPSLLVAPASLLANWAAEAERFAPGLRVVIAHASAMPAAELRTLDSEHLDNVDLVITSYGTLMRLPKLTEIQWRIAVIDEAQAIKNPSTRQTRQVKKILAQTRIALTGTPVENRLSDLWSIFDFTHPALLGTQKVFADFSKRLAEAEHFGPLRNLVRPYILRRLKTDKRVIADLPDKTELKAWCHLSPVQAALYQRAVEDLTEALSEAEGVRRKGVVFAFLMRFKQICNHPSQWLGDAAWQAKDSGKFARLRELAEVISAKQEKLLVFTQFRETTAPLATYLGSIFGREGLVLHGGTPVKKRRELVQRFQEDELIPFFVLSLKAGGSGLNLTAASHVIHFDRWWNPAVENQATDRAFRIGQKRNVLVHKFVCRGTIEERIDELIEAKHKLTHDVLEGGAELPLVEMSDRELLDLVKLDIHTAQEN